MKTPSLNQLSPLALLPCLLAVSPDASAAIVCSPSAMPGADIVSLRGNCIDDITNMQLTSGIEIWRVSSPAGDHPLDPRQIPNGSLDVLAPTLPGEYTFYITHINDGYGGSVNLGGEGGYPQVTVTVNGACDAPVSGDASRAHIASRRRTPHAPGCDGVDPTLSQVVSTLTTLQTDHMRRHLSQADARLRLLRAGRTGPRFDVQGVPLPTAPKDEAGSGRNNRLGFYVSGLGDYLRQAAAAGQSELTSRTDMLSIGADYRLNDDWAFGANVGASRSRVSFASSASQQRSRGTQATAYASWNVTQAAYLSATLSHEANRFDLTRDDGTGVLSYGSPRGRGWGFSVSGGRDFASGPWSIGPYVRWDHVISRVDAFDETGSASALSVSAHRTRSNTLNVGAQTQFSIPVSWGLVLPHVRVELTRRKDSTAQAANATLLIDNTPVFESTGAEIDRNYGAVAVGVAGVNQGGASWFADWESTVAQQGYRARRIVLGLRFEL